MCSRNLHRDNLSNRAGGRAQTWNNGRSKTQAAESAMLRSECSSVVKLAATTLNRPAQRSKKTPPVFSGLRKCTKASPNGEAFQDKALVMSCCSLRSSIAAARTKAHKDEGLPEWGGLLG
jgi:hypothetical protein